MKRIILFTIVISMVWLINSGPMDNTSITGESMGQSYSLEKSVCGVVSHETIEISLEEGTGSISQKTTLYYPDLDGDGYGDNSATGSEDQQPGYVEDNTDCDDRDRDVNPGAAEIPGDDIDNNCNGEIDESVEMNWYEDRDGDGYGNPDAYIVQTEQPDGYVADNTDCDDSDSKVYPGAEEIADGVDNDCDGIIDEGLEEYWYEDADGDGYGNPDIFEYQTEQPDGYVADNTDCDDSNEAVNPGAEEIADGVDNDCDGSVDEETTNRWYEDADGDGYGDASSFIDQQSVPDGYVGNDLDCDDTNSDVHPGAEEIADGIDNDCDGTVDEGFENYWYQDADGDGYGDPDNYEIQTEQPEGFVDNDLDCDDSNSDVHPGAEEIADGIDNDCDGTVDEELEEHWYEDADNDGYGNSDSFVIQALSPEGYVDNDLDCDDSNSDVHPGAEEIDGDGIDNNCDGIIDSESTSTWYEDADGDGYGDGSSVVEQENAPEGYVNNDLDCDDSNSGIHPGAEEILGDGIDNDCDGDIDEDDGIESPSIDLSFNPSSFIIILSLIAIPIIKSRKH